MARATSLFTAANLLSLARLPLGVLFWVVLHAGWGGPTGGPWLATLVLVLAGVTDLLDGALARRALARQTGGKVQGTPAGAGSWLDPICDKLFVVMVLAAIWSVRRPGLGILAMIVARELAQLPLSVIYALVPSLRRWLRYDFRASVLGKAATVLQFCAILALLFAEPSATLFAVVSFVVGLVALGDYVRRAIRIGQQRLREQEEVPRSPR
jgi:phosphatidylglycerophosphate synthase